MSLSEQFLQYNQQHQLINKHQPVLLAVSGGVDSSVLCDLFSKAGFLFHIAHCNFLLRGEESTRDKNFVKQLAAKYGVSFHVIHFETEQYANENKISIQVAARELRYDWLEKMRKEIGCVSIATAHHRDDNVETVLMNFCKGTGIAGLHGILPRKEKLIRPLLFASRQQIEEYALTNNISFVTDSSNLTEKYTRNYFRQTVIPAIEKVFPAAKDNMINNIQRFSEVEILYEEAIDIHRKKLLEKHGDEYHIPVLKLAKTHPLRTIIRELFRPFGFQQGQIDELIKLLQSESGKQIFSHSHRVIRNRKWLIISPLNATDISTVIIEQGQHHIEAGNINIHIKNITARDFNIPTDNHIACLDARHIEYPLQLRKWKQGDYFYPLGLRKKKKLSRFFIDQKLSLAEKEKIWVLTSGERIVWIVGHRIDDRFKITSDTKDILLLTKS